MGGKLTVSSKKGVGTTISFTIPLQRVEEKITNLEEKQENSIENEDSSRKASLPIFSSNYSDAKKNSNQTTNENTAARKKSFTLPSGTVMRILIVEDNNINQTVLKHFLQKSLDPSSVVIECACNGKIGVELYQNNPHHLVLMDLVLSFFFVFFNFFGKILKKEHTRR